MAANNHGANLLRDAVTRIPIYTGDGNDTFKPDQWLKRITKAVSLLDGTMLTLCHLYMSP